MHAHRPVHRAWISENLLDLLGVDGPPQALILHCSDDQCTIGRGRKQRHRHGQPDSCVYVPLGESRPLPAELATALYLYRAFSNNTSVGTVAVLRPARDPSRTLSPKFVASGRIGPASPASIADAMLQAEWCQTRSGAAVCSSASGTVGELAVGALEYEVVARRSLLHCRLGYEQSAPDHIVEPAAAAAPRISVQPRGSRDASISRIGSRMQLAGGCQWLPGSRTMPDADARQAVMTRMEGAIVSKATESGTTRLNG